MLAYDSSLTFTTAPWLSVARANVKGASVGNYALFAGGKANSFCTTVDAYNASLTRTTATALSSAENNSAAATVGNHAIFVGNTASADIYDASLTKTSAAILSTARTGLAATTVGRLRHLFRRWSGRFLRRISDPEQHRHQHDGL